MSFADAPVDEKQSFSVADSPCERVGDFKTGADNYRCPNKAELLIVSLYECSHRCSHTLRVCVECLDAYLDEKRAKYVKCQAGADCPRMERRLSVETIGAL